MLLPYYIASLNIEHEYFAKTNEYEAFEGICFADTLGLAEGQQLSLFVEENTERVQREKDAQIMVVIGNPPYNVGQERENDNNKNRKYPLIDHRIHETYAKASKATLNTKPYDAYVKFFRWATDRLQGRDGVVCLVTNNSFLDQTAFDSMRKCLLQDFTQIYHLDLHGNVRKNPKLSGTIHNVFGIQVGVGITIAVHASNHSNRTLYYYRVPEDWRKTEKLNFIREKENISGIAWREMKPDERHTWITDGMYSEFTTFLPMGSKEAKSAKNVELGTLFKSYSLGVSTNRDNVVYDFNIQILAARIQQFIEDYGAEIFRWVRAGKPKDVDDFVSYEKIKWSRNLKRDLQHERYIQFDKNAIRESLYRPYTRKLLYYADVLNDERGTISSFFPSSLTETENVIIILKIGSEWPRFALAANVIPCLLPQGGSQCFPFYTYSADGSNRRENITDWALQQFHEKYSPEVTKWNIFHYVYGMLHHPQYRERYKENLKRDLPHIPLLLRREAFETCVRVGKQLMDIHLNYEQAKEYRLKWVEDEDVPFNTCVEKMRLTPDRTAVVVNESLTLSDIPQECFQYRLGNRSALEWVIDQYQVSKDKRSGIESDPNRIDDPEYIVHLVEKVVTVSVETVKLVNALAQAVTVEDWLGEMVAAKE
ncbi:MAG TPA: type ISP restriction/modification enzyme [Ktedonobacteraceae bacterium]